MLFEPSSCKFMFVDPKLQFVSKYFTSTCKSAGSWSNLASKLKGSHTCLSVVPIIFPFLVNFWLRQELKESQSLCVRPVQVCLEQSIFLGQRAIGELSEQSESNQKTLRAFSELSASS